MLFAKFKNQTARRNLFAKVDILGSFDFYTSLISLESLSARDIQEMHNAFRGESIAKIIGNGALSPDQYTWAAKILPLAAHEYTHFLDATSTLWGFRHLGLMNEAYLSSDKYGVPESHFSKAKHFYDHCRRIGLPSYYIVVNSGVENIRPWQSKMSIGHLFSSAGAPTDTPILFSRFSNFHGDLLARSPVSMVSLLEASAMAQELLLLSTLIQLTEPDFRLVELRHFSQRTVDYLYNPEITEYSVCAHILANQQKCSDILATFRLCAIIVRTLLNLPEQSIQKIADSCPIDQLLKSPDDIAFAKGIRNGLRHGDLGVLYYLICTALPERSYVSRGAAINGVNEALRILGADFENVRSEATTRAAELCADIVNTTIQPISAIAKAGYDNFQKISNSEPELNFAALSLPPSLLSDSSVSIIFDADGNMLKDFDFENCFDQLCAGQSWVERFAEACV